MTQTTVNWSADLAAARSFEEVCAVTLRAARLLADADGATFVVRDGEYCFYVNEDAIAPLWKGQRFPLGECISGWAMRHDDVAAIPDIQLDERIPQDAYRPTFVRSLTMVPIGRGRPAGALGVYWAQPGRGVTAAGRTALLELASAAGQAVARLGLESAPWAPNFALSS